MTQVASCRLRDVPVRTVVEESISPTGYFVARSATAFRNQTGKLRVIPGFGFSQNQDDAAVTSRYEVYEHLAGHYEFQAARGSCSFESRDWPGGHTGPAFSAPDVLLSMDAPSAHLGRNDASGLAHHSTYSRAANHAVLELVERHLLCEIWWEGLQVVRCSPTERIDDLTSIRTYTVAGARMGLPFALAIVNRTSDALWLCGSAVRATLQEAVAHAREEALMLLDNFARNRNWSHDQVGEAERLHALKGPLSEQRAAHFSNRVVDGSAGRGRSDSWPAVDIAARVLPGSRIFVASLWRDEDSIVVRATSADAKRVPAFRRICSSATPRDPFM